MKKKLKTDTQFYIKQIRSHNFSPILMIIIVSLEKKKQFNFKRVTRNLRIKLRVINLTTFTFCFYEKSEYINKIQSKVKKPRRIKMVVPFIQYGFNL